jgi:FkbM family methyltransferase
VSKTDTAPLDGWRRTLHYKLRFGLARLPLFPARYRLRTGGEPDFFFRWTRVMPFMDPGKGAFDFELYGWDVRELRFLRRFLQPGMTFVDLGAHHGLYSVLASALVGPAGRVLAFEPTPSIVRRLRWHVRLNGGRNVEVFAAAVGAKKSTVTLFVPTHGVDTISSLRPPGRTSAPVQRIEVELVALDDVIAARHLEAVDLIKLDVEGAEPQVLDGATQLLARQRTLWLFEALDSTSAEFGGSARALVDRFAAGHALFEFTPEGWLQPHTPRESYPHDSNCNLLAVPPNRRGDVERFLAR